jgi:hypothetical protein
MSRYPTRHGSVGDARPRIALLIDPRFPGGTASALAREIHALAGFADLSIHAVETQMFRGSEANPKITAALEAEGLDLRPMPSVLQAETVVFHNPASLKFDTAFPRRIVCENALVVTHENCLRPNGVEGYDVGHCLALLKRALICKRRLLAPVSGYNRRTAERWTAETGSDWAIAPFDWFNICDFELLPPTSVPRDRRGRHSRPGFDKFPSLSRLLRQFPGTAEACRILGGDIFLHNLDVIPEHWDVIPFGGEEVDAFLASIDFFVYYTSPQIQESFGRVIAEAIAAGKVVITDPGTAETYGDAVLAREDCDVDATIAEFVARPGAYARQVELAQARLRDFSSETFRNTVFKGLRALREMPNALL